MKNKNLMKFINKSSLDNVDRELEEREITLDELETLETTSFYDVAIEEPIPATQEEYIRPVSSKSIIASDMVINGNVTTEGDLVIEGAVDGDVACGGSLELNGKIKGLIKAKELHVNISKVDGDVQCDGHCHISSETVIKGNVKADSITIDGSIEGNVLVQGKMVLKGNGSLIGDCVAGCFVIEEGAVVKGNLQTQTVQ